LLLTGCKRTDQINVGDGKIPPPADVTLRIGRVLVDIAKDHTISTIGYNGSVPGPLIRLREGVPVMVEIFNDTDLSELVHWHGQIVAVEIDGAAEEMSMSDLTRGTYSGQFGFVYIDPKVNAGRYDREVFLATHNLSRSSGPRRWKTFSSRWAARANSVASRSTVKATTKARRHYTS
jgi:hypothetical protein